MESKIKIFVVCHKPTYVLDNPLLIPVQVGAAQAIQRLPGMRYDDEGDNISIKNPIYCELTAQYWAWKQMDCDYYGFFHYRRYMSFDQIYPLYSDGRFTGRKPRRLYYELDDIHDDLKKYQLDAEWMEHQIRQYDILTILRENINTTVYRQYCQYHPSEDLDQIVKILKEKFPEYAAAADEYLNSKQVYYMNMFIMKKEYFHRYMYWLFSILDEFEKAMQEDGNELRPRMAGYLAERLFGVFYTYQRQNGAKCAEMPYLKFYNTALSPGTDVVDCIRTFPLKPTKIKIRIDIRKLNRLFPAGSKRRILLRSIFLR